MPFPRCPFAREEIPIIIMENLKAKGFQMYDATKGWTVDHFKITLLEMARFHAAGYHVIQHSRKGAVGLREDFPLIADLGYEGIIQIKTESFKEEVGKSISSVIKSGINIIAQNMGDKDILRRFRNWNVMEGASNSLRPSEDFDVICRADSWSNNFLFKYDEESGKPVEVRFVDLQLAMRGRPTFDLAVLFATSATPKMRRENQECLLRLYHDCLLYTSPSPRDS